MRQTHGTDGMSGADHVSSNATKSVDGETASSTSSEPIAIIDMSCKFPGGATSPKKLWRLCVEGRDSWSRIPESRFNAAAFFHENPEKTDSVSISSQSPQAVLNDE